MHSAIQELVDTIRDLTLREIHIVTYDPNTTFYMQTVIRQLLEADQNQQQQQLAAGDDGTDEEDEEETSEDDDENASAGEEQQQNENVGRRVDGRKSARDFDHFESASRHDSGTPDPDKRANAAQLKMDGAGARSYVRSSSPTDATDAESRHRSLPAAASDKNVAGTEVKLSTDGRRFTSLSHFEKSNDKYSTDTN
jgi:hypothetical protein